MLILPERAIKLALQAILCSCGGLYKTAASWVHPAPRTLKVTPRFGIRDPERTEFIDN